VSGKGLGAALLMVKLQATLRALGSSSSPPASLIANTNRILIRDAVPGRFASMLFMEIGERRGEVRYVNAGHMPPLILSAQGVRELTKGDTALGLSPRAAYREETVSLAANEFFIVYSDGITEARNAEGQFYGLERFKKLLESSASLPARSLGERVVQSVTTFIGEAKVSDDLSLVVLQRTADSSRS
jgi:sigma-B regulation protein RsbU (phosphoserine phosphatase)